MITNRIPEGKEVDVLLAAHERKEAEESKCDHADLECGHCIDCGEYVSPTRAFRNSWKGGDA